VVLAVDALGVDPQQHGDAVPGAHSATWTSATPPFSHVET
jgi:hypothetical protein